MHISLEIPRERVIESYESIYDAAVIYFPEFCYHILSDAIFLHFSRFPLTFAAHAAIAKTPRHILRVMAAFYRLRYVASAAFMRRVSANTFSYHSALAPLRHGFSSSMGHERCRHAAILHDIFQGARAGSRAASSKWSIMPGIRRVRRRPGHCRLAEILLPRAETN